MPRHSLVAGFGEEAADVTFRTRSTGLVYNYLRWFLTTLQETGKPQADAQLGVRAKQEIAAAVPRRPDEHVGLREAMKGGLESFTLPDARAVAAEQRRQGGCQLSRRGHHLWNIALRGPDERRPSVSWRSRARVLISIISSFQFHPG
ncbi:MAG: hypothetical protein ACRD2X_27440 [Vicinamibacteraceae bacterium]